MCVFCIDSVVRHSVFRAFLVPSKCILQSYGGDTQVWFKGIYLLDKLGVLEILVHAWVQIPLPPFGSC